MKHVQVKLDTKKRQTSWRFYFWIKKLPPKNSMHTTVRNYYQRWQIGPLLLEWYHELHVDEDPVEPRKYNEIMTNRK